MTPADQIDALRRHNATLREWLDRAKADAERFREERDAALAEAFEECARIADACADERMRQTPACILAGGAVEALGGKETEARRIAHLIRTRLAEKSPGVKI